MACNDLNNAELMELIRQHTCIYEKSDKDYRDRNVKANAWKFIAEKLGCDQDDCKTRYKTIRTRFTKYLASLKLPSGSGATAVLKPQFESLRWLMNHVGNSRDTVSNYRLPKPVTAEPLSESESEHEIGAVEKPSAEGPSEEQDNIRPPVTPATPVAKTLNPSADSRSSISVSSRKRKRTEQENGDQFEKEMADVLRKERERFSDPDTLFCLSLVGKFKELRPDQRDAVQIEILQAFQRVRAPLQPSQLNTAQYSQPPLFSLSQPTHYVESLHTSQQSAGPAPYNLSQHLC